MYQTFNESEEGNRERRVVLTNPRRILENALFRITNIRLYESIIELRRSEPRRGRWKEGSTLTATSFNGHMGGKTASRGVPGTRSSSATSSRSKQKCKQPYTNTTHPTRSNELAHHSPKNVNVSVILVS
jgi:hypothetical protein